jgi:hypothetical protein
VLIGPHHQNNNNNVGDRDRLYVLWSRSLSPNVWSCMSYRRNSSTVFICIICQKTTHTERSCLSVCPWVCKKCWTNRERNTVGSKMGRSLWPNSSWNAILSNNGPLSDPVVETRSKIEDWIRWLLQNNGNRAPFQNGTITPPKKQDHNYQPDDCESQKSAVNCFVIYYFSLSIYLSCQFVRSQSVFDLYI